MQKYFDEIVRDIQKIIRFDSSAAPAEAGAPFGKGAKAALDFFLSRAKEWGMETRDYDGYGGEVTLGEGEEFGVLVHLDVVPAGEGWTHPPFGGIVENGRLYGRGATDDKGPAVVLLYALKKLKDEGVPLRRKIRLIAGCNEESGWACIEHIKRVSHLPEEGFTPDASFPVIYAEKGILHLTLTFPLSAPPFDFFEGGTAANMVCAKAISRPKNAPEGGFPRLIEGVAIYRDGEFLVAEGKSAHASTPEEGVNALQGLLAYYAKESKECRKIYDLLFADSLSLKAMQDETGCLTLSPDTVSFSGGVLSVVVDIRYPATKKQSDVTDRLQKAGVDFTVKHAQAPLYNPPQGKLIQTLLEVYEEATGKTAAPVAIGGGTYARALKNGCGFGPEEEGEPSSIHRPDEYVSLENIKKWSEIYHRALLRIAT